MPLRGYVFASATTNEGLVIVDFHVKPNGALVLPELLARWRSSAHRGTLCPHPEVTVYGTESATRTRPQSFACGGFRYTAPPHFGNSSGAEHSHAKHWSMNLPSPAFA